MYIDKEMFSDQLTRVVDLDDRPTLHPTLPRPPKVACHESYELTDVEGLLTQRVAKSLSLHFCSIILVFRPRIPKLLHVLVAPVQE